MWNGRANRERRERAPGARQSGGRGRSRGLVNRDRASVNVAGAATTADASRRGVACLSPGASCRAVRRWVPAGRAAERTTPRLALGAGGAWNRPVLRMEAYPTEYDLHAKTLRRLRVDRHAADTPSRGRRRHFFRRRSWAPSRTRRIRAERCVDRDRGGEWRDGSWSCSTVQCGDQWDSSLKRQIASPMIDSKRCASG